MLKDLLVFVELLAILGILVALAMYFTVDPPANAIPTPVNPQITDSVT